MGMGVGVVMVVLVAMVVAMVVVMPVLVVMPMVMPVVVIMVMRVRMVVVGPVFMRVPGLAQHLLVFGFLLGRAATRLTHDEILPDDMLRVTL